MTKFKDFKLSDGLLRAVSKMGIETPTLIQEKAIPEILEGKDVIGESSTGSGKTLVFACGIIDNIKMDEGVQALILTPTRELAVQVKSVFYDLSYFKKIRTVAVYGGDSMDRQVRDVKKAHVIVATPGRLLDHIQKRTINLSKIKFLILDEADRMLDMGFIKDVEKIMKYCPREKQTLFFSATISWQLEKLINEYLNDGIFISATKEVDPSKLKQIYYDVPGKKKLSLLIHLIKNEKSKLTIVFCNTKRGVDFVSKNLSYNKVKNVAVHGGMAQKKRLNNIKRIHDNDVRVLVCTDVAARGIHIPDVSHVYNYDIPRDPTEYVHRIGRTARAGKSGLVLNFLASADYENFSKVCEHHRDYKIEKVETPFLERVLIDKKEDKKSSGRNKGRRSFSKKSRNFGRVRNSRKKSVGRNNFRRNRN